MDQTPTKKQLKTRSTKNSNWINGFFSTYLAWFFHNLCHGYIQKLHQLTSLCLCISNQRMWNLKKDHLSQKIFLFKIIIYEWKFIINYSKTWLRRTNRINGTKILIWINYIQVLFWLFPKGMLRKYDWCFFLWFLYKKEIIPFSFYILFFLGFKNKKNHFILKKF
jgi:hypothetical protein